MVFLLERLTVKIVAIAVATNRVVKTVSHIVPFLALAKRIVYPRAQPGDAAFDAFVFHWLGVIGGSNHPEHFIWVFLGMAGELFAKNFERADYFVPAAGETRGRALERGFETLLVSDCLKFGILNSLKHDRV